MARQEGALRLAGRGVHRPPRWRAPGRPFEGGRRGVPARQADPRRGPCAVRVPGGHAQPRRRAAGGPRRRRITGAADRGADRAGRDRRFRPGVAARPAAATSRRPGDGPCRFPVPPRRRAPCRRRERGRQGPGHGRHHAQDRCAPPRAPKRRIRGLNGAPCDNRHVGIVQEVRIAKRTGFCYGVREAIDKAKEASAAGKATHTLGQVVHNEGVVRDLQDLGIRTVETLDDVDHGAAVVIRAHGVRPDVMARADARGLEVIDGTCTWVIQEQKELQKLVEDGYTIVLLGTPKHPEVVGLLGFAPDAIVVDEEEEWDAAIPRKKRMALISQSTQPPWKFEKLAAMMVSRAHELKIVNTVCPVTIRRQQDTLDTAAEVDLMVVVGGRSSANTKELTRLCEIAGTPAVQIESAKDLVDESAFAGREVVGVTGGTSTPIEDLHAVTRRILELAGTPETAARATEIADEALSAAWTPAGRTTSIPTTSAPTAG